MECSRPQEKISRNRVSDIRKVEKILITKCRALYDKFGKNIFNRIFLSLQKNIIVFNNLISSFMKKELFIIKMYCRKILSFQFAEKDF